MAEGGDNISVLAGDQRFGIVGVSLLGVSFLMHFAGGHSKVFSSSLMHSLVMVPFWAATSSHGSSPSLAQTGTFEGNMAFDLGGCYQRGN